MPACSCVWITTRVASITACSDGSAPSQSGNGYEPTTVVLMRGSVIGRGLQPVARHCWLRCSLLLSAPFIEVAHTRCQMPEHGMTDLPDRFRDADHLEEVMTAPTPELVAELSSVEGDIIILGVGGKIGPTLARLAKRTAPRKRVV